MVSTGSAPIQTTPDKIKHPDQDAQELTDADLDQVSGDVPRDPRGEFDSGDALQATEDARFPLQATK